MTYTKTINGWVDDKGNPVTLPNKLDFSKPIRLGISGLNQSNTYRSFKSNKGLSVSLSDSEVCTNPHEAAEKLAHAYNEKFKGVDSVQASDIVPETYYAGQNKEFNSYNRLTPPTDEAKKNFTKKDIDYLEHQNGYDFHNDEPQETTINSDGTIEGPAAVEIDAKEHEQFIKQELDKMDQNPDYHKEVEAMPSPDIGTTPIPNTATLADAA